MFEDHLDDTADTSCIVCGCPNVIFDSDPAPCCGAEFCRECGEWSPAGADCGCFVEIRPSS